MRCEARAAVRFDSFCVQVPVAIRRLDESTDALAPFVVRETDNCCVGDRGMLSENVSDFVRIDGLATGDDTIACSSFDPETAIFTYAADISRPETV